MTQLHFRRLDPASPQDLLDWQHVFRGAQSFTFATQGRPPTDADAQRMMRTLPGGRPQDDVHLFAIDVDGFREVGRRELPDLVGQAICIDKPLDSRPW